MGRRQRQRSRAGGLAELSAPDYDYVDAEGNVLTLRGALSPATRRHYAQALAGSPLSREDAWQRATELLFEHLARRWVIADLELSGQRELLGRLRLASRAQRDWVRGTLREHCAAHFPELQAP